jgi:hypothetical protein
LTRVVESKPPQTIALLAAGNLAVACALVGDHPRARTITQELWTRVKGSAFPYQSASALLEAAIALQLIGDLELANEASIEASRLAHKHGYHEIAILSESLTDRVMRLRQTATRALSSEATLVAEQVESLERLFQPGDHAAAVSIT